MFFFGSDILKNILTKEQLSRLNDAYDAPELWLNPEVSNFFDYDNSKELKDIKLLNYKHHDKIKMDVAV